MISLCLSSWVGKRGMPIVAFGGVLAAVTIGLFLDCLGPNTVFAYRDSAHFYPPLYRLVVNEWLAGRVPLWNHLLNGGQPLAGMATSGSFYPPQVVLTILLPEALALNVLCIGHLAFAAVAAALLARQQCVSWPAATVAGLTYAFSGPVLFQIYNPIFAAGAAWMAWAVFAGWRLVHLGGLANGLLLAIALAMSVLCGDPQAGYHAGLLLGLAVLMLALPWKRSFLLLAAAAAFAGLLALVQIALAAEYTRNTARAMDLAPQSIWQIPEFLARNDQSPDRANWYDIIIGRAPKIARQYRTSYGFSLAPWRVVELIWPGFSGSFHSRWTIAAKIDPAAVWAFSLYAGIGGLLLTISCCCRSGCSSLRRLWGVVAVVSLLTSVGAYGGIGVIRNLVAVATGSWDQLGYRPGDEVGSCYWLWMTFLPGYDGFRYPSKWLTLFALAGSQLAAVGVDGLAEPGVRKMVSRTAAGIAVFVAAVLAVLTIAAWALGPANLLPTAKGTASQSRDLWLVLAGGLQAVVMAIATGKAMQLDDRRRWWLVAIVAVDLVIAGRGNLNTADYRAFQAGGDFLEELADVRPAACRAASPRMRIAASGSGGSLIPPSGSDLFMRYLGMTMTSHAPWVHGVEKIAEASTAMQADADLLFRPFVRDGRSIAPRRAFDLAGVEFFVIANERSVLDDSEAFATAWSKVQKQGAYAGMAPAGPPLPMIDLPLPGGDQSLPLIYVIRNDSALPRVRIVRKAVGVPPVSKREWDRWIDLLKRIAFPNPEVPELVETVLLESTSPTVLKQPDSGQPSDVPPADHCRIVVDEPQRVVIEAALAEPGLVVLSDSFNSDWSLAVSTDGDPPEPTQILRANQLHRACWLPAGRHRLEYRYRSATFARTAPVSVVAWLMAAGAAGFLGWQRSRTR